MWLIHPNSFFAATSAEVNGSVPAPLGGDAARPVEGQVEPETAAPLPLHGVGDVAAVIRMSGGGATPGGQSAPGVQFTPGTQRTLGSSTSSTCTAR